MTSFLKYLVEVSLCISVFLLIYLLLFKGKTFFQLNRVYLLTGLLLSFVIPLVTLPDNIAGEEDLISIVTAERIETEYIPFLLDDTAEASSFSAVYMIAVFYLAGVCFFTLRLIWGIRAMFMMKKKSTRRVNNGTRVYIHDSLQTFSFFTMLFASPHASAHEIEHECVHIREKHWIDRFAVELVSVLLWFNPIMILYKRAVKNVHEFLADQGAVKNLADVEAYLHCLMNATIAYSRAPITSHFGSPTLKNRIIMLTKNKTPFYKVILYVLVLPVAALLLLAFQDSRSATGKPEDVNASLTIQSVPDGVPVEKDKLKRMFEFGERFNPVTNKMQQHTGKDFITNGGVNVMATGDGVVIDAAFDEIKGNYVVIRHSNELVTQYFHMRSLTVKKGVSIRKGEVIGFVGSTGLSIKDHVHYEVLKNGKAVDPNEYLPKEFGKGDGC